MKVVYSVMRWEGKEFDDLMGLFSNKEVAQEFLDLITKEDKDFDAEVKNDPEDEYDCENYPVSYTIQELPLCSSISEIEYAHQEMIKKKALKKLTPEEKKALGLS